LWDEPIHAEWNALRAKAHKELVLAFERLIKNPWLILHNSILFHDYLGYRVAFATKEELCTIVMQCLEIPIAPNQHFLQHDCIKNILRRSKEYDEEMNRVFDNIVIAKKLL
jgi:hypothetical protein